MRILGIDPGTATTGFGAIETDREKLKMLGAGVIKTPPEHTLPERLKTIHEEVAELIAEFKPELVSVELLFFANNVTTAFAVGQARGVVLLAAAEAGLRLVEFTPLQVKQAVTGYGKADKRQVQEMVQRLLKLDALPKPDDAADALAVAIAAANAQKVS